MASLRLFIPPMPPIPGEGDAVDAGGGEAIWERVRPRASEVLLPPPPKECRECGRTDYAVSVIDRGGTRTCSACLTGKTLQRQGRG